MGKEKKSLHICAECAAKKDGEDTVFGEFNLSEMLYNLSGQFDFPVELEELLGISGDSKDKKQITPAKKNIVTCPKCGWNSEQFSSTGRLGCTNCYTLFSTIIDEALKNMQRGTFHIGKHPSHAREDNLQNRQRMELVHLQKELEELVQREAYEEAAIIRDKINELKECCHVSKDEVGEDAS
jgi:protein arginine kinase activator